METPPCCWTKWFWRRKISSTKRTSLWMFSAQKNFAAKLENLTLFRLEIFSVKSHFFLVNFKKARLVSKCYKTRSQFLRKNQHFFREINVFTKELISRIFICVITFCSTFPHCASSCHWFHEIFLRRSCNSLIILHIYFIFTRLTKWVLQL